jgi:hypothetical protein
MSVDTKNMSMEMLAEKWQPIIEKAEETPIQDSWKKKVTLRLLENQEQAMLTEAPVNVTGGAATWDPVMIQMIRRNTPKLIAFDIFGVQPMTGPTGLIFAIRSRYVDSDKDQAGTEALFDEANSGFSGLRDTMTTIGTTPTWAGKGTPDGTLTDPTADNYGHGQVMSTAAAELLGSTNVWNEMAFSIEKSTVTAGSRGLKATWSIELAQDLKAVHGLDADSEMTQILSTEITTEINRELVRRAYVLAKQGALTSSGTAVAGTFNCDVDSNGRWSVERFKGLMFQIEKEANLIALQTRRGKGNFLIVSADVASAMAMTGLLDTGRGADYLSPNLVDASGMTYVGMLNGRTKVFVDPYTSINSVLVGYKGANQYDAGAYYCPYVPLTLYKAQGQDDFQPRIGFKTRYGFKGNPFASETASQNPYFRIFRVTNL